jgi:hypothetical protein
MNPVHTLTFNFLKIHFDITLSCTHNLRSSLLPSGFPTKMLCLFPIVPENAAREITQRSIKKSKIEWKRISFLYWLFSFNSYF